MHLSIIYTKAHMIVSYSFRNYGASPIKDDNAHSTHASPSWYAVNKYILFSYLNLAFISQITIKLMADHTVDCSLGL